MIWWIVGGAILGAALPFVFYYLEDWFWRHGI